MVLALFKNMCPNCGGEIDENRLELGLPCSNCLPDASVLSEERNKNSIRDFHKLVKAELEKNGKLCNYILMVKQDELFDDFQNFFYEVSGSEMWSAQASWAKRILNGESFAVVAPTGVGKTFFLSLMAIYYAKNRGRVLVVTPTSMLAKQTGSHLRSFVQKAGFNLQIVELHSALENKARQEALKKIVKGEFDILLLTSAGLAKKYKLIQNVHFSLVSVDDVDSLLKMSKNIDRVLQLIGYTPEVLQDAFTLVIDKIKLFHFLMEENKEKEIEELNLEISHLKEALGKFTEKNKVGQIVVSSATGKTRGIKSKIFRELLGFEAGSVLEFIRNIKDVTESVKGNLLDQAVSEAKRLGPGGLFYIAHDLGAHVGHELALKMNTAGVKSVYVESQSRKALDLFQQGDLDVLIGTASYYGVLVRGLDLPERIRYAIFVGVPKFKFKLKSEEAHPARLIQLLWVISDLLIDPEKKRDLANRAIKLKRLTRHMSVEDLMIIDKAIKNNQQLGGYLGKVQTTIIENKNILDSMVHDPSILDKLKQSSELIIREIDGELYLVVPDVMTYIQASGRTSRMFVNGLTQGLAIVLVDDEKAMEALARQATLYIEDSQWFKSEEVNWPELIAKIDSDREIVKKELMGVIQGVIQDPIKSAMLVVESPNKARAIAGFFGKPTRRIMGDIVSYDVSMLNYLMTIVASGGHLMDLPTSGEGIYGIKEINGNYVPIFTSIKRCNSCGTVFTDELTKCPNCCSGLLHDSRSTMRALQRLASEVSQVFICTDPDSEGEKIAWDIYINLSPYSRKISRGVFHEVTRKALMEAVLNPRTIDERLVEAQIVRRIDDRWVGFQLSKYMKELPTSETDPKRKPQSAGRVQNPVLGWIIERYRQHQANLQNIYLVTLKNQEKELKLEVSLDRNINIKEGAQKLNAAIATVTSVETGEPKIVNPRPPFSTDELLHSASTMLHMDVVETMKTAQELFESGLITYHRTDSIHVSTTGMGIAKQFLEVKYGPNVDQVYKPRGWGPEGAHEAIRPTKPLDENQLKRAVADNTIHAPLDLKWSHYSLYNLIFTRFIASQMAPAIVIEQKFTIQMQNSEDLKVEVQHDGIVEVVSYGWALVDSVRVSPKLSVGETFSVNVEKFWRGTTPQYRLLTEGEVVSMMKQKGIGRPSTYAATVQKLKKHGYIIASKKLGYLIPTAKGILAYEILSKNFPSLVCEEATRKLEEALMNIESGKVGYQEQLRAINNEIMELYNQASGVSQTAICQ